MSLARKHVIFAAVLAFIAWGYATHWLPTLRFLPYAFVFGVIVTIAAQTYLFLSYPQKKQRRQYGEGYPARNVAFIQPQVWMAERQELEKRSAYISEALYAESPVVTRSIDKLIVLILRDFVNSWYGAISKRPSFTNEVDRAIRASLSNILDRVIELDVVGIAVSRFVPKITAHLNAFLEAERAVRGSKLSKTLTESEELDLAIAGKYRNGKLHPAASLAFADPKMAQQGYLRSVVARLLPQVLPSAMMTSRAVTVLIQELVACAVLYPVVGMLSDPDTWHQLIAQYGKAILQERKTVKKLRAALDEHSSSVASPKTIRSAPFPRLQPGDNERKYERFIRAIRKCNTISEARRFRSEVAAQLHRDSALDDPDLLYLRRLETGKRALDQRIAQLGTGGSVKTSHHTSRRTSHEGKGASASNLVALSLRQVLYSVNGLTCFMEYMDRVHRMNLVQFWIVVDGVRNPLEEDDDTADEQQQIDKENGVTKQMWTEADRNIIASISENYLTQPHIRISPLSREVVRVFLKAGHQATNAQYWAARKIILRTQTSVYEEMQETHFPNFKKSDLWFKLLASEESAPSQARTPVSPGSQSPTRDSLDGGRPAKPARLLTAPAKVKAPDLRRQVASASDLKGFIQRADSDTEKSARRSFDTSHGKRSLFDDDSQRRPLFDDDLNDDPLANSVASLDSDHDTPATSAANNQVIDAMQEALNDIMDEPLDKDSLFAENGATSHQDGDSLRSSMELSRPMSPAVGMLEGKKGKPSVASLGLLGTPGKRGVFEDELFAEEQPKFIEDEHEDSVSSGNDDEPLVEAAPGDLGLAEAIDNLTLDIEKLVTQESIVDSLTKKAELTNNAAELRILKKSKASLQREINRKELQRQQFIIQESDNSLFGRASLAIQSVMVGKDAEGREYAVYVIEVRRTQAGPGETAASWVVARRYSEFHDLNKRLRSRFPSIRNLEFPRRQIGLKLQRDFLQKRRISLERYLQELLKIPAVCRSREFRAFLSQQLIQPVVDHGSTAGGEVDQKDFVSRIYNSVTDGMEEFLGNIPVLDQLSLAGQNLISAAATQLQTQQQMPSSATSVNPPPLLNHAEDLDQATALEAEAELRALEAPGTSIAPNASDSFVKPLCDLFLELFSLNSTTSTSNSNWLRGRTLVLILQQLLGGTIERRVRDAATTYLSADGIAKLLGTLIDSMWPGGKRKEPGTGEAERGPKQKEQAKREAEIVLGGLVPEMVGSVVGRSNAGMAARRLGAAVGNKRLLTHLVFELLDEVVAVVFEGQKQSKAMSNGKSKR